MQNAFVHLSALLTVIWFGMGAAVAQTTITERATAICRDARAAGEPAIESRVADLQKIVAGTQPRNDAERAVAAKQLVEAMHSLECFRQDRQSPVQMRSGGARIATVTAFYATNRKVDNQNGLASYYGSTYSPDLAYGALEVSIPDTHAEGELELPSLWKFERTPDPKLHFVLRSLTPLPQSRFDAQVKATLARADKKSLLLFVHGYYSSFEDTALRTAQLAVDLKFPGVPMFYSWPSAGQAWGYGNDADNTRLNERIFRRLLDDVAALPFDDIYIIAHSMGAQIVTEAMLHRHEARMPMERFRHLLLAAPDINAEYFRTAIAPAFAALGTTRKSIYVSSKDVALKLSRLFNGTKRVGDASGGVVVYPGWETIDASGTAPIVRAFGHSYVLDSAPVLRDVEDTLVVNLPASLRRLRKMGSPPSDYWMLQ